MSTIRIYTTLFLRVYNGQKVFDYVFVIFIIARLMGFVAWGNVVQSSFHNYISSYEMHGVIETCGGECSYVSGYVSD